jgi:hypothetical protein
MSPSRESPSRDRQRVQDVLARARDEMQSLTGRPIDGVSGVRHGEDGWEITLELVELERIPNSTSVLGTYEVLVDGDGSVIEYRRTGRYYRNQATEGDGA